MIFDFSAARSTRPAIITSSRASYRRCRGFLACVRDGLDPHRIKERLGFSRYSYEYTLSKLVRLGLVAYGGMGCGSPGKAPASSVTAWAPQAAMT